MDSTSSSSEMQYDYEFVRNKSSFTGSDPEMQQRRLNNLCGHAVGMLKQLHSQNFGVAHNVDAVFKNCLEKITTKTPKTNTTASETDPKTIRSAAKKFKKDIKRFEKSIANILRIYQIAVLKEHAKTALSTNVELTPYQETQLEQLAKGGVHAFWVRTKALFFSSDKKIVSAFTQAHQKMLTASKQTIEISKNATEVQKSQLEKFTAYQTRGKQKRNGVLSVDHTFRFVPSFQEDSILKQFQAFCAQSQSLIVRKRFEKPLTGILVDNKPVYSVLTPLNKEFDQIFDMPNSTFEKIHGQAGSSSAHREGHHLSNAYLSELSVDKNSYYQAIRHAILSSNPKETNKQKREEDAQRQATELLTAAVMKDLKKHNDTLPLVYHPTIISTSLVTPFLISHGERQMWDDQRKALSAMNGQPTPIKIGDQWISVTPKIHAFNFGVNKAAVKFGLGAIKQYFQNRQALRQLMGSVENISTSHKEYGAAKGLLQEVQRLTKTPWSYLENGNQYEVGAKLVCLANILDRIQIGHTGTINCKSAKDRTQILDAVAKTFMTMYEQSQTFPTSELLKTDATTRSQFKKIFATMVKESGGLEITEINTGALGLKVDEMILICGFTLTELLEIQGTSATAGA